MASSLMSLIDQSGSSSPGSSPGQGHCVVFLGKTLSQCLSIYLFSMQPGLQMGSGEFIAEDNPGMDRHPI